MTAIVGFMNRHGVAMAADSAVTLGNTHKVINTGNKIFSLSKYAPVGIATYGNASFMETPWEIIIKLYRKALGKTKYPTLEEYIESFLDFLHKKDFFVSEDIQKKILARRMLDFYFISIDNVKHATGSKDVKAESLLKEFQDCERCNKSDKINRLSEMEEYSYDRFEEFSRESYHSISSELTCITTEELKNAFLTSFFNYLLIHIKYGSDTGLVFFGYGEDEIYPSIANIIVLDSFDKKLRYRVDQGGSGMVDIGGATAWVIPFAQTNVSQTIIRGINPDFYDLLSKGVNNTLDLYRDSIVNLLSSDESSHDEIIQKIKLFSHQDITNQFISALSDSFRKHYTNPLVNTIASLSKEDMSTMAESFVELTSLVRRMSPGEETVGGPIDVAVISKGDGFIWMKRKHYFDAELNPNFINNYYDNE